MWGVISLSVALISATGTPQHLNSAVVDLGRCASVKEARCVRAAALLTNAGNTANKMLLDAFPRLSAAGQVHALEVFNGQRNNKTSTRALMKIASSRSYSPVIRSVALSNLATRRGHGVVKALIKAQSNRDHTIRAAATRALGTRPSAGNKKVLRALNRASRDRHPTVRAEALMGLGFVGKPAAVRSLVKGLKDTEVTVRSAAVEGLRLVSAKTAVGPLIETLRVEPDNAVRVGISKTLKRQTGLNYGKNWEAWQAWYESRSRH